MKMLLGGSFRIGRATTRARKKASFAGVPVQAQRIIIRRKKS
jgi:hypothetical protein